MLLQYLNISTFHITISNCHFCWKVFSWDESASVLIKGDSETTDLKYPAVTICPKISTKYAIAERLGNYIDPGNLPEGLLELQQEIFLCVTGLMDGDGFVGTIGWGVNDFVNWYFNACETIFKHPGCLVWKNV